MHIPLFYKRRRVTSFKGKMPRLLIIVIESIISVNLTFRFYILGFKYVR